MTSAITTTTAPSKPLRKLVALAALCKSLQATAAVNVYSPVYNFNNGTVDDTKKCQSDEWSRIQTAVGDALGGAGRVLLRSPDSHRRLRMKCSDCGDKPLCLATVGLGCALLGKRRLTERQDERGLTTGPCSSKNAAVESALSAILPTVSASCQALLNAPRHIQCAEYTNNCDIYGFTAIRSFTEKVITKINTTENGNAPTSFCSSVGNIAIRANTNFFLGSVTFSISGRHTSGREYANVTTVEAIQPYVSFGKVYASQNPLLSSSRNIPYVPKPHIIGRVLYPGVYTILAFSQDNPTEGKTATFTVKSC